MVTDDTVLRVKGSSSATSLAAAIAHRVYAGKKTSLRGIGAAAVNQAVKAAIIAQGYVASKGHILWWNGGFSDVTMPDGVVTAVTLNLKVE